MAYRNTSCLASWLNQRQVVCLHSAYIYLLKIYLNTWRYWRYSGLSSGAIFSRRLLFQHSVLKLPAEYLGTARVALCRSLGWLHHLAGVVSLLYVGSADQFRSLDAFLPNRETLRHYTVSSNVAANTRLLHIWTAHSMQIRTIHQRGSRFSWHDISAYITVTGLG